MKQTASDNTNVTTSPDFEHLNAAVSHVNELVSTGHIAANAAKGLLYGLTEVLGTLVGDPDLPEQAKSGYQGLLDWVHELQWKLTPK